MNDEQKQMLQAKQELDAKVLEYAMAPDLHRADLQTLANEPYDAELPMGAVAEAIAKTASVPKGGDYLYWAIDPTTKTVYTVVEGGVTQVPITVTAPNTLTFSHYESPEDYIYIPDLVESKYDALAGKVKDQHEGLNRLENKLVLDAVIAAAVSAGNTFANDSGDSKIDFKKLVEMVRDMAKYGSKLVLLSGSTVTTNLVLMDYDENKQREVTVEKAGISQWIKVENYQYTHSGTQTVLAADKAVLVATNDSMDNRPIHVVRRKLGFTAVDAKERLTVVAGPGHFVGAARKLAFSSVTYESLGIVVVNKNVCAVYKDAAVYA